jgi:hypothetical protein
MRQAFVIATIPLTLLAGCAKSSPASEAPTPEPLATTTEAPVAAPVKLPAVPANSLETIDYPGTYSHGSDILRLGSDMTYVFTKGDGSVVTGNYSELPDHVRIKLDDFDDGQPAWFSIASGAIYRLANENTPPQQVTADGEYIREPDVPSAAPVTPIPLPSSD